MRGAHATPSVERNQSSDRAVALEEVGQCFFDGFLRVDAALQSSGDPPGELEFDKGLSQTGARDRGGGRGPGARARDRRVADPPRRLQEQTTG